MLKLCFLNPLYFLLLVGAVAVPSHGQDRVHERTVASNPLAGSPTRPAVYLPVQTGHAMVCNRLHGDRGHMPIQRHCLDYCNCDSRGIVLCYSKSGRSAPRHISVVRGRFPLTEPSTQPLATRYFARRPATTIPDVARTPPHRLPEQMSLRGNSPASSPALAFLRRLVPSHPRAALSRWRRSLRWTQQPACEARFPKSPRPLPGAFRP